MVIFGPVTERKTEKNLHPFLTEDPSEIIRKGEFNKVPWVVGTVENEGNLRASRKYPHIASVSDINRRKLLALLRLEESRMKLNAAFSQLMPNMLGMSLSVPDASIETTWSKLKQFYLEGANGVNVGDSRNVQGIINVRHSSLLIFQ